MRNQGYLFEHIVEICEGIDIEWFIHTFMNGKTRMYLDEAHPRFLNEAASDLFDHFVMVDLDNDRTKIRKTKKRFRLSTNELYWVGWMYAYMQYKADKQSKAIYKIFTSERMLELYSPGHEMSKETFYDKIKQELEVND